MKSLFGGLREIAASAVEKFDAHSPAIKTKLAEVGRDAKTQATVAMKVLEAKSEEAKDLVQKVVADERTQGFVSSISNGFNNVKENVSSVVSSAIDKHSSAKSSTPEIQDEDQAKMSKAIKKLGGRDKVGVSAEVLSAAGGAAAGVAAAGTVAGVAGATTLLGSTGLASLLGGIFVTTTPVGWVIGSAFLAGAAGYGLAKMVRSGAAQDRTRKELVERLSKRLEAMQEQSAERASLIELTQLVAVAITAGLITESQGQRMVDLVEKGALNSTLAVERLKAMALSAGVIEAVDPA